MTTRYLKILDNLATNQNHPWTFEREIHAQGLVLKILIQQSWDLGVNVLKKGTTRTSIPITAHLAFRLPATPVHV